MPTTVKARRKYGANSLDLTIPASICKEYGIEVGDVFEIKTERTNGKIRLIYTKIYRYDE